MQPRPQDLPVVTYEAAIRAVTRSTRRAPLRAKSAPERLPALVLTEEERAARAALPVLERWLLRRSRGRYDFDSYVYFSRQDYRA